MLLSFAKALTSLILNIRFAFPCFVAEDKLVSMKARPV